MTEQARRVTVDPFYHEYVSVGVYHEVKGQRKNWIKQYPQVQMKCK